MSDKLNNKTSNKNKSKYFTNITYPKHNTWDKNKYLSHINIENVRTSLVNSIRRTIISDVETIGIRTLPYNKSQVSVITNNTPLYDQFVADRLSLIPIHMPDVPNINVDEYEIILSVKNNANLPKDIFSSDIKIKKISNMTYMSDSDVNKIFPPDPITKQHIFLNVLKPKFYQNTEASNDEDFTMNSEHILSAGAANSKISVSKKELGLTLSARLCKSNGKENGRFNPTCLAQHKFVIDDKKAEEALKDYLLNNENKTNKTKEELIRRFNTSQRGRYYYTDHNGDANKFIMEIESIGVIPPLIILYRSMDYLLNRIRKFQKNIDVFNNKNNHIENEYIEVIPSDIKINGYELVIQNEDDTLGNLLNDYINYLYCSPREGKDAEQLESVSYIRTHPQKLEIRMIIQPKDNMDFNEVSNRFIKPTTKYLIDLIEHMKKELEKSPLLISEIKYVKSMPK